MGRKLKLRMRGRCIGGLFIPDNPEKFKKGIEYYEGDMVDIIIEKAVKKRSYNQNAYYRGVVVKMLADHLGIDRQEMHYILRDLFGLKQVISTKITTINMELFEFVKEIELSTKDYNTGEFEQYLSNIRMWAASEHGLSIPLPNEIEIPNYYFT